MTKSYIAKSSEVTQKYYVIDAQDKVLGRLATKAATILRGKHKRTYTPHVDTGDFVVVINAEKIRVTGKKLEDKMYIKYTGFHSGLKSIALKDLLAKHTKILVSSKLSILSSILSLPKEKILTYDKL
jgi:large subunit ribosomal protein L13